MKKFKKCLTAILAFAMMVSFFPLHELRVSANEIDAGTAALNVNVVGNGTVTVKDSENEYFASEEEGLTVDVDVGAVLELSFSADTDAELKEVIVNNETVEVVENKLSYSIGTEGADISVVFTAIENAVNEVADNLVVKSSDGGVVTVIDNTGSHVVDNEFSYAYETGTKVDVEIASNYHYYIESIVVNGVEKDEYGFDSIYEGISDIVITDGVSTVEVIFGEYPDTLPLADGDTVKITKGTKHEYDGYYTNEYWIHADGYQFLGSCAEPVKDGPDGETFTATKVSDAIFRYLMWCYQSDEFRDEAFGAVEEDEQFILLHTTLGYYYCGEQGFGEMENSGEYWINKADDVLNWVRKVFYGSNEERYVKARTAARYTFDTYIAWGGENYQDIVWIQPQDVDLVISKRSTTDLTSGERYLTGAKFELYAWNGSSYSTKVAASVDNGDGTYTFKGINYMSATDGKFLVKEVTAPTGYSKPYYFYNSDDSSDYSKYGGREFVLDKSYLEWSCDSTKNHSDSLAGFTFYNSPENKTVTVTKTDADTGVKLSGATFELYAWNGSSYSNKVGTLKDNGNGTYSINVPFDASTVRDGYYYYLIKETKAPDGYGLTSDGINTTYDGKEIYFDKNGTMQSAASNLTFANKSISVDLTITKRSKTDLTSGDGNKLLTGAVFELYAWNGSSYSTKAATAKDNGDGTYTFPAISRSLTTSGKFLVVEKTAPAGYSNAYWTYDHAADTNSYHTYGGREFVLSMSGAWTCTSTSTYSNPSAGFTFLDNPNQVTLTVTKTDADTGVKLTGAAFDLYAYRSNGYTYKAGSFTDNKNGTYSIKFNFDLATKDANGEYKYLVKETKAPDGYVMSSSDKVVIYSSNGTLKTPALELTVSNKAQNGKLQLKKSSANPEITNNNSCYSLEGAEYTVYSDSACTAAAGVLKTNADGTSNILSLKTGTYYVKETKEPKGYVKDTQKYTVTLTSAHASTVYVLDVKEKADMDPVGVLLYKVDADTMQPNPQGFGTLGSAEFTVKYYATEGTTDPAKDGKTPVRTWVFETNEDGYTYYAKSFLVSGDDLYISDDGFPSIPLGVITIQETKAPEGYLLNDTVYVVPITADGTTNGVSTYAIPIIPEDILKLDLTKTEFGTGTPIPGAVFEYTRPDGSKETLTTDSNGKLSIKGLEYGTHVIREISVQDGYYVNSNEIKFSVDKNNKVTILSTAAVTDTNGNIAVTVNAEGNVEAVVEDKLVPYSVQIIKTNDKGTALAGAEFTVYSDKACTQVVTKGTTDRNGLIKLSGLVYGSTYYFKETKAPQGYKLPENVPVYEVKGESSPVNGTWNFYVNGTKYTVADTDTSKGIYLSGDASGRILNLKMVNNIGLLLPETGSGMTFICFFVGTALMLSVFIMNKKKKQSN